MSDVEDMDDTPSGGKTTGKEPTATPDDNSPTEPPQMPPGKDMLDSGGGTPDVEGTVSGNEATEKKPNPTVEGGNTTKPSENDLKRSLPLESDDTSGSVAKINPKNDAVSDEDHKSKKPKNPESLPWHHPITSLFMKRSYSQPSYNKGIVK